MNLKNTSDKKLHIVSLDIPIPANYGGAIDIFNKIKCLHNAGIKITLHNFQYGGRKVENELLDYCEEVFYYHRNNSKTNLLSNKPFIVISRSSKKLLERLAADDAPILFEGLHSCLYLPHQKLRNKRKIVRTHNIEHEYYKGLAMAENNKLKALYFYSEINKLKKFEKKLALADALAVISKNDALHFSKIAKNIEVISAFHSSNDVIIKKGLGNYALYHGSLDVSENNRAALFLVNEIFNDIDINLIIAGNRPSSELKNACENKSNIDLRYNLSENDFNDLIDNAQVNILPTFQATGIKLKLLLALHHGRHILVNSPMVENTGLEELCNIANTADDMKNLLLKLFQKEFDEADIEKRKSVLLNSIFSNKYNTEKLIKLIYG